MSEAGIEGEAPPVDETISEDDLRAQQRFGLAAVAGIAAALAGAALWAAVVFVTHYEVGLVAIAVGAMTGLAVRIAGRGIDPQFGFLGAACAALGCLLGMAMGSVAMLSQTFNVGFGEALTTLDPDGIVSLTMETSSPMDLLFLGIALYEGYRFAFAPHSEAE